MVPLDPDCPDSAPEDRSRLYRILDANLNRCGEGLRVVEEYLRFVREDVHLASLCKTLRHDLRVAAGPLPLEQLAAARDSLGDVGAEVVTPQEYQRVDLQAVAQANLKRVEQSLRGLEEYAKLIEPAAAASFERLRYRAYTLERALVGLDANLIRLANVRLYLLLDAQPSLPAFTSLVQSLLPTGVGAIQLRDKQLSDRVLLERARVLRELTHERDVLFIMNDRVDVAVLAQADGVHLGQDDLSAAAARRVMGPHALIGVSTHHIDQARQAVLDGASYLGCGPTFPSTTKSFATFPGLEFLRQVSQEIRLPAFAIGGVAPGNVGEVRAAGFQRVAVSQAVVGAADPAAAAREMLALLEAPPL